ncbi:hypothetical protein [Streptomyces macrosporus]|uniref:Secreted protein n=1 Tax=Streptomyces macrosporus TaxID=44032 RepID=A0ABP5XNN8_9ACTN
MQTPHSRRSARFPCRRGRPLPAVAAVATAAALALTPGVPAAAVGTPAGPDPASELTLDPHHADGAPAVGVRAVCEDGGSGGIVSSPAFERTVGLERAGEGGPDGERRAVATLRPGLPVGHSYPVVAVCGTGEPLSTSFVHTGARAADRPPPDGLPPGPTVGGIALAGLACGLLVLRRRRPRPARARVRLG